MGFIYLASGVLFDSMNEEGRLLHIATGTCVDLDPLATLFLRIALSTETKARALAVLAGSVDATLEQLEESLQVMLDHLVTHHFLSTTASFDTERDETEQMLAFSAEVMMPMPLPPLSKHTHVDWEFFLTGRVVNSPLTHFSCFRRAYACWKTGTSLLFVGYTHSVTILFESLGQSRQAGKMRQRVWEAHARRLSCLGNHQSKMDADDAMRVARLELVFCQMLVRLLAPTALCLVRSIAFCTYLRALDLPATVVIGRACFDLSGQYSFHAWTELAGEVVNDHAELQSGYAIMARIPSLEKMDINAQIFMKRERCNGSAISLERWQMQMLRFLFKWKSQPGEISGKSGTGRNE